jgi:amino acid transporter
MFGGRWWVWAAVVWSVVALLGVMRVPLLAGLLGWLLVTELLVVVLFIVGALAHPAGAGLSTVALQPGRLMGNGSGGVLAFSIAAYTGYESPAAYDEEARDKKTVGRATFGALAVLCVLYAVAAWALTVAVGPAEVVARSADADLPLMLLERTYGTVYGPLIAGLGRVLLVTSSLAAMLSFHSAVARYLFALGRDGVLPGWLGATGSADPLVREAPVRGSLAQTVVAAVVVAAFAVCGADPVNTLFSWLASVAAVGVLTLLVATSVGAYRWFRRGGGGRENAWTRVGAPRIGAAVGTAVLATMLVRFGALLGVKAGSPLTLVLPGLVVAAALAGLLWAAHLRARHPLVWLRIGRGRPHPLAVPDRRLSDLEV